MVLRTGAVMICTLLFCLANLYVSGEVHVEPIRPRANEYRWCGESSRICEGPRGRFRIGILSQLSDELVLDYGWEHNSYLFEDDAGENTLFMSLTWRPFQ